jgi:hypothetical protein
MTQFHITAWRAGISVAVLAGAVATTIWLMLRNRPSPDEQERARRKLLAQSGRLVDGMLLDLYELDGTDGRVITMLVFSYRIGGVDYECSQDITALLNIIRPADVRAGFPCSVRYQPGNPHNSIVIAEDWTGLRPVPVRAPPMDQSATTGTVPPSAP